MSINFLIRAYIIQEYYKLRRLEGFSNRWIYERLRMWYPMSMGTFYNYLGVPARRELKQRQFDVSLLGRYLDIAFRGLKMIEEDLKMNEVKPRKNLKPRMHE